MGTDPPVTIHRADYAPPAYTVDSTDLDCHLDSKVTQVEALMAVTRLGSPEPALRFAGDAATLPQIEMYGTPLSAEGLGRALKQYCTRLR